MTLITSGSPTQKQAWIPKLLAGKGAFALALSEAEAGSDAGALQTRAVKSGKNWKITGRKIWISGAKAALQMVVAARTDSKSRGGKGVTLFLVSPDAKGISMTPLEKIGNRCSLSYDIGFDEVLVSDEARLGVIGEGFDCLKKNTVLCSFWISIGSCWDCTGSCGCCSGTRPGTQTIWPIDWTFSGAST
ncbi:MAG: hypothetical protein CM15mP80_09800 [Alphaproteobacteria bacterium]|nr:MAG: hypothetical protein CM15mP80_09800 [Alphaproteobacteria bacterium]